MSDDFFWEATKAARVLAERDLSLEGSKRFLMTFF
jgi:hypothetical protein